MTSDPITTWRMPGWATSTRLGDDGVVYCRVVPVRDLPLAVMARQQDAIEVTGGRVLLRRGPLEVVLDGLVLPRPGAVALAAALSEVIEVTAGAA